MIPANELRIGNWVNRMFFNPWPGNEDFALDPCKIERFSPDTCNLLLKDKSIIGKYKLDSLEPLPLTPEILEKAGFELYSSGWYEKGFGRNVLNINLQANRLSIDDERNSRQEASMPLLAFHVHQLQNLYHALTGQELNIIL